MERPRWVGRLGAFSTIGIVTGLVFLLGLASWLPHTLLAPFVAPQHVDRPAAGFAIAFPLDWEYADTGGADPEEWWDREKVEDVHAHHEQVVGGGGVLLARTRSPFVFHYCVLYDITDYAAEPLAWTSLAHVPSDAQDWTTDSDRARDVRTEFLELPAGQVVRTDVRWADGLREISYFYMEGTRWFRLTCTTDDGTPEDRWLSVAETFDFLSVEGLSRPVLGPAPQRVERPEVGYALRLPYGWQHVDAAEADPHEWWDAAAIDDVEAYHESLVAEGLLLMARAYLPTERSRQRCDLDDLTDLATMYPAWTTLEDAERDIRAWSGVDPELIAFETDYVELGAGRVLSIDSRWQGDVVARDYVHTKDGRWFRLCCWTQGTPPVDGWLSIADTFEFLTEEEYATTNRNR